MFSMAAGTGRQVAVNNVWTAGLFLAAQGQVNGVAAVTDVFRLSGMFVVPGVEAPPVSRAPLILRPYDQELALCQRYYRKSFDLATVVGSAGSIGCHALYLDGLPSGFGRSLITSVTFGGPMRAIPTMTFWSPSGAIGKARSGVSGADMNCVASVVSPGGFNYTAGPEGATSTQQWNHTVNWAADARL